MNKVWYTKEQIDDGVGCFTNGKNTAIYVSDKRKAEGKDDVYCTADPQDLPGSGLELVGYARNDRKLVVNWL